jgi:hypothetical protein
MAMLVWLTATHMVKPTIEHCNGHQQVLTHVYVKKLIFIQNHYLTIIIHHLI